MHTYESGTTRFHFNSDLSGDVEIINTKTDQHLTVPGDDLLAFVANYVINAKITELESMEPLEVLLSQRFG